VNLLNRDNDLEVFVRATNIDKHRVTFHSLFYRILTPTSTNFLDFGSVLLNSPTIRTFIIDNISNKNLLLDISSSLPDEIKIYTKADNISRSSPTGGTTSSNDSREMMKESFGDKRMLIRSVNSPSSPALRESSLIRMPEVSRPEVLNPEYLDLASSGRRTEEESVQSSNGTPELSERVHVWKREPSSVDRINDSEIMSRGRTQIPKQTNINQNDTNDLGKAPEVNSHITSERVKDTASNVLTSLRYAVTNNNLALVDLLEAGGLSLDELVALLEVFTGTPAPVFASSGSEERYIRAQRLLKNQLDDAIESKSIVPISTADIAAASELIVIIVFTPTNSNKLFVQV
jgi:hypothetical protein